VLPRIKPALHRIWRDDTTLQVGLDPEHAVVITGLDAALRHVVDSLTGTRPLESVLTYGQAHGASRSSVHKLLQLLGEAGALDDARALDDLASPSPTEWERLRPDLEACSVAHGDPHAGAEALLRRRNSSVTVFGAGRVGALITSLIAAAGVGRVTVVDRAVTQPADLSPGGLATCDLGSPRADGAARAAQHAAPSCRVASGRTCPPAPPPDVAVVVPDVEPDRRLADAFVRAEIPHLVVRIREGRGILGPFVLPGVSSCIRCHDLQRAARDPGWPKVLSQVLEQPRPAPTADITLSTLLAAYAVLHVLTFLQGKRPASVDGTLELDLRTGVPRRRSWSPHPACGCQFGPTADDSDQARPPGPRARSSA